MTEGPANVLPARILVVEDEADLRDAVAEYLSRNGFLVRAAGDAAAARTLLAEQPADVVLLDLSMPGEDGLSLARWMRTQPACPGIIMVTAASDLADRVVGLEIGADDYMVKPFSPRELVARVRAILRRSSAPTESKEKTAISSSAFSIDEERVAISFKGSPLDLSRLEYKLLCVLIRNPGRVYSRDELMDRAWEEPDMSLARTVDTHIKTIRGKLRAIDPNADPIITHRGFGYSLKTPL